MGHVSSRIRRDQVPGTRFKKRTRATATLLGATLSRREREGKSLPASQPVDPAVSPRESERHRRPARGAPDGASRDRSANGRLAQIIRYLRPPTITKIGPSGSFQNCRWTRETRRRFFVHAHTAYPLHVERVAPEWNRAHLHMLAIEPTLICTPDLLRRWADRHARPDDDVA